MDREERSVYEFGEFRLDPHRRLLTRSNGDRVPLTGKAFDTLLYLVERAGAPVTRAALTEALWPSTVVEENNLSQAVSVVRRTLGEDVIATIPRRGYQFTAEVRRASPHVSPHTALDARVTAAAAHLAAGTPVRSRALRATSRFGSAAVAACAIASVWLFRFGGASGDPLEGYVFSKLTGFDGAEEQAAISRDGRLVAFLRQRDADWDVWVGQIGTGDFRNLTDGTMRELRNPNVRTLGFFPDGSHVLIWTRISDQQSGGVVDGGWALPTLGGLPRPWRTGIAELDWSPDGQQVAFHTAAAGDPLFIGDAAARSDARQIYVGPAGVHAHFPVWSRNGRFLYFVRGIVPDEMDLWRIRTDEADGAPERLTFHNSRVSFPIVLDERTLLYLATAEDGSGPWIHAFDVERRQSRRIDTRGQEYASLAASADGRRLVAAQVRSTTSLWHMRLQSADGEEDAPLRLDIVSPHASSPRFGAQSLVYRATNAATDGIWKIENGSAVELWSEPQARVIGGPALSPDGRVAFCVLDGSRGQLHVANADGSGARKLADGLDVRGAPAWSPDARWITVGAMHDGAPRLVNVPVEGGDAVVLSNDYALDPAWAPSGEFIVFSGADVGTNFTVGAVNADGSARPLPSIVVSRGSRRLDFVDDEHLVLLKGTLAHKDSGWSTCEPERSRCSRRSRRDR